MKINTKIASLSKLVASEASRFVLSAIQYDGKTAVATDGHQLTIVTDRGEAESGTPMLLHVDALNLIKKLSPAKKQYGSIFTTEVQPGETLDTITVSDSTAEIKAQATTSHVNGNYPDYERIRVKPENVPVRYQCDAKFLVKVLQGIIDLDKDNKQAVAVSLEFGRCESPMRVTYQNADFDIESNLAPCRDSLTRGQYASKEKLEREISRRITEAAKQIRAEMETKPEVKAESEAAA